MNPLAFRGGCGFCVLFMALSIPVTFAALSILPQDYTLQYSGAYNIYVQGMGSNEAYSLKSNGAAVWIYGWKDSTGKVQSQTKKGTWIASKGKIQVFIRGNTGTIKETYYLINGEFVSSDNNKRCLKKRST